MVTNSIGTILYSLLNGKKIGEDNQGNKFYIHKKNKKKRWVLYKKKIDPTILEVEWQIWLTKTDTDKETILNKQSFKWQKSKKANFRRLRTNVTEFLPFRSQEPQILGRLS